MNGKGIEIWPEVLKYERDFFEGNTHGKGKFYCANGSWYNGDFSNHEIQGSGTFVNKMESYIKEKGALLKGIEMVKANDQLTRNTLVYNKNNEKSEFGYFNNLMEQ